MAEPTYTLSAHCAGLTFTASNWPAGSALLISTGQARGGSIVRVSKTFTGSTTERVEFPVGQSANTYSIQVTAANVNPLVLKGSMTSCTPRYANQLASVVQPPPGW
jgi:hypothetical protein